MKEIKKSMVVCEYANEFETCKGCAHAEVHAENNETFEEILCSNLCECSLAFDGKKTIYTKCIPINKIGYDKLLDVLNKKTQ